VVGNLQRSLVVKRARPLLFLGHVNFSAFKDDAEYGMIEI